MTRWASSLSARSASGERAPGADVLLECDAAFALGEFRTHVHFHAPGTEASKHGLTGVQAGTQFLQANRREALAAIGALRREDDRRAFDRLAVAGEPELHAIQPPKGLGRVGHEWTDRDVDVVAMSKSRGNRREREHERSEQHGDEQQLEGAGPHDCGFATPTDAH